LTTVEYASIYSLLILNSIYCGIQSTSFSYALFDMDGNQVPQELVSKIGETFEVILQEASQFI